MTPVSVDSSHLSCLELPCTCIDFKLVLESKRSSNLGRQEWNESCKLELWAKAYNGALLANNILGSMKRWWPEKSSTIFHLLFLLKLEWTNIGTRKMEPIMTESIRKLSNFNVQCAKTFTRIFYAISHSFLHFSRAIIVISYL